MVEFNCLSLLKQRFVFPGAHKCPFPPCLVFCVVFLHLNSCPLLEDLAPRYFHPTLWTTAFLAYSTAPISYLFSHLLLLATSTCLFYFLGYFFDLLFQLCYWPISFFTVMVYFLCALCFLTFFFLKQPFLFHRFYVIFNFSGI